MRVRPVELDVVGIVLHAFHYAVAVGIPSARNPGKLKRLLCARPGALKQCLVAADLPVQPRMDDLPHLAVRRCKPKRALPSGSILRENASPRHRPSSSQKRCAAMTAQTTGTGMRWLSRSSTHACSCQSSIPRVVAALKAVKLAIGGAETCCCGQRRKIRAGCLFHCRGQRALAQSLGKHTSPRFQVFQIPAACRHGIPRALEAGSIELPIMDLPSPGGAAQPHQSGVRLGNRQPRGRIQNCRLPWGDRSLQAQHADGVVRLRLRAQIPCL